MLIVVNNFFEGLFVVTELFSITFSTVGFINLLTSISLGSISKFVLVTLATADQSCVQEGHGQDCRQSLSTCPCHILEVVPEQPAQWGSFTMLENKGHLIFDCHRLCKLISVHFCMEIVSNDDKPLYPVRKVPHPTCHNTFIKRSYGHRHLKVKNWSYLGHAETI